MARFVESLKTYLEGLGHGPFFVGNTPDQPQDVLVLTDAGGLPTTLDENPPGAPEQYSIQIRARRRRQQDARDVLLAIQRDLHRLQGTNLGDFSVFAAEAIDRPAILRREDRESWVLVSNYEIHARENI
jgi:hypothetical protein